MKILMAHNFYQSKGGEDIAFSQDSDLIERAGHEVRRFIVNNDHIVGTKAKIRATVSILNNRETLTAFKRELNEFKPAIVHIHNFFPTLSPASIEIAASCSIPVVQTLHNYRSICAAGTLLRNGNVCEDCVGGSRWPGVFYRCYRRSFTGSAAVGTIGPYLKKLIKKYPRYLTMVALTKFSRSRYVADGFPGDSILVRGNVIPDPGTNLEIDRKGLVYVGRLSVEKGVDTLIRAAKLFDGPVEIVGDGPERERLKSMSSRNVRFTGELSHTEAVERMRRAAAIAIPSRWYEGFPMVVLEAMATGTPVLASAIGSLAEIVQHKQTGLLVEPNSIEAWLDSLQFVSRQPQQMAEMGKTARNQFLNFHSEAVGLQSLMDVYASALARAS